MLTLLALVLAALTATPPHDAAWAASLKPGQTVTLPAGNYRGPWKIGTGVHLIALPGAVLEGGSPVLTIDGDAVIVEGLTIRVSREGTGVSANGASGGLLRNLHVIGGSRGVSFKRGAMQLRDSLIEQSGKFGVWIQGGQATLENVQVRAQRGSAIFIGHANATLSALTIESAEYGLLAYGAQLTVSGSHFSKVTRAGAGINTSSGSIVDTEWEGPFSEAALSITAATSMILRGNKIHRAGSMGIKLLNSTATLSQNEIATTRSDRNGLEGDGLFASGCELDSSSDRLIDNAGVALAIMGGHAAVRGCEIENAGQAAVSVSAHGQLILSGCKISGGSSEQIVAPGASLQDGSGGR